MNLKEKISETRRWWKNLPEIQKSSLIMVWLMVGFASGFLVCFLHMASKNPVIIEGEGALLFAMSGIALFGFVGWFALMHYTFYLERRIKQLEEKNKNEG